MTPIRPVFQKIAWPRLALLAVLCLLAVLGASHKAAAQTASVAGDHLTQAMDCAGGDALLQGSFNVVIFSGACKSLTLRGDRNQVKIGVAGAPPGAMLDVQGNGDQVQYFLPADGTAPRLAVLGAGTAVAAGAGSLVLPANIARAPVVLRAEGVAQIVDCTGADVTIEGKNDQYTLTGGCHSLVVRGDGISVQAALRPGAKVLAEGNGNQIRWRLSAPGAAPAVVVRGRNSRAASADATPPVAVASAAPPSAAPPSAAPRPASAAAPVAAPVAEAAPAAHGGTLVLNGDDEVRDLDCAGQDVRIEATGGLYALRGGCHSLQIIGPRARVQAELAAGANIMIAGAGSNLAYVLPPGANARKQISGAGSHAWRIGALGDLTMAQAALLIAPPSAPVSVGAAPGSTTNLPTGALAKP